MWLNSLRDLTMLVFGLLKRFWNQFTKKTVLKYWIISFMWPKNVMNITIYILNMPSFLPYKVLHFLGKTSVLIINFDLKRYECRKISMYECRYSMVQWMYKKLYWRLDKNNDYFNIISNISKFMFSFIFLVNSKFVLQSFENFSFFQVYWT